LLFRVRDGDPLVYLDHDSVVFVLHQGSIIDGTDR
jgi:hypothetical protein